MVALHDWLEQHADTLDQEQHLADELMPALAAAGPGGPGPLVTQLGKSAGLGPRPVPVLVVPGALSRDEIRKLALP